MNNMDCLGELGWVWIALKRKTQHACFFSMGPMYCSQDSQVRISANFTLKLGLTALFIHLKIILLQCFQFSTISGIQTDP